MLVEGVGMMVGYRVHNVKIVGSHPFSSAIGFLTPFKISGNFHALPFLSS